MNTSILSGLCSMMLLGTLPGCGDSQKLAEMENVKQMEKANLENFDDLDFNVYTGQKWDQLGKSYAKDITVHWPDGRMTKGIDAHIKDLSGQFVFASDARIKEHPIRIASGDWTAVTGIMEGTFTQPMATDGLRPPLNRSVGRTGLLCQIESLQGVLPAQARPVVDIGTISDAALDRWHA